MEPSVSSWSYVKERRPAANLESDGTDGQHRIELSDEDRAELMRARALTLPFQDVQRARLSSMRLRGWWTRRSRPDWIPPRVVGSGEDGSSTTAEGLRTSRARVARAVFPPQQVAEVIAIACELPATRGRPLGSFSRSELHRLVIERGVTDASASTIWRWLHDDAFKPWQLRSWIFPRDPQFQPKAGRVLDLYDAAFEGRDCSRTSTSSAPMRNPSCKRWHAATPLSPRPRASGLGRVRVPARWHARLLGRVGRAPRSPVRPLRAKTGIVPFGRLVDQVMSSEPYARQVGVLDRRQRLKPLRARFRAADGREPSKRRADPPPRPRLLADQIELYFSIVQRKALTPNDFQNLDALADRRRRSPSTTASSPADSSATSPAMVSRILATISTATPTSTRGLTIRTSGGLAWVRRRVVGS